MNALGDLYLSTRTNRASSFGQVRVGQALPLTAASFEVALVELQLQGTT